MLDYHFEGVTLLITHYNRSKSLERLLKGFAALNCSFEKIIVSDDASKEEHLAYMSNLQKTYDFEVVTAPVNKGLGNNINKGLDAIQTPFTLYVQEDFIPLPSFPLVFKNAVEIVKERSDMDMVRFYAYFKYPYLKPYRDGFSEMKFKIWYWGYNKFYYYSDHPHLQRNNFKEKFGPYLEGANVEVGEYKMMMKFLQKKGKAMYYDAFKEVFSQENTVAEPSTFKRNWLRESNNYFVFLIRETYRFLKFNMDYLFR
ncbi:MAG: glycosyltransferase [Chitinophagaceae bacterium]|nr:glycosyltransferase [Chitinophagaceae bacterium]